MHTFHAKVKNWSNTDSLCEILNEMSLNFKFMLMLCRYKAVTLKNNLRTKKNTRIKIKLNFIFVKYYFINERKGVVFVTFCDILQV